jgi:hypothetical protein
MVEPIPSYYISCLHEDLLQDRSKQFLALFSSNVTLILRQLPEMITRYETLVNGGGNLEGRGRACKYSHMQKKCCLRGFVIYFISFKG